MDYGKRWELWVIGKRLGQSQYHILNTGPGKVLVSSGKSRVAGTQCSTGNCSPMPRAAC